MFFLDHIWIIPLLPAIGAALMFFFGKKLQKQTVSAVCVGAVALAFLMSCGAVWEYTHSQARAKCSKRSCTRGWAAIPAILPTRPKDGYPAEFKAQVGFLLDPLSCIWLLFVTGVGTLIHIYSTGYMAHEGGYYRFFGYLNLFMFSMLTLILGEQLRPDVCWLGRGRPVLVPFDRILFPPQIGQRCREQSIHRQPNR